MGIKFESSLLQTKIQQKKLPTSTIIFNKHDIMQTKYYRFKAYYTMLDKITTNFTINYQIQRKNILL